MADVKLPVEEDGAAEADVVQPIDEQDLEEQNRPDIPDELNILPLRDSVIYPMLIAPLSVSRQSSMQLIDESLSESNRIIGVVAQKNAETEDPSFEDVYDTGCAVIVRTLVKMPDSVRLIVQGIVRFNIVEVLQEEPFLRAKIEVIEDDSVPDEKKEEFEALRRSIASLFDQAIRHSQMLPDELRSLTESVSEPPVMTDLVAAHMPMSVENKQTILEAYELEDRMRKLLEMLGKEVRVLELSTKVQSQVSAELSRTQREYYLREQLKAIQRELGEYDDSDEDAGELRKRIEELDLPQEARREANRELDRLKRINPGSPEYSVARTYLETITALPWNTSSEDTVDLKRVREVLDRDHFGLEKIKQRIVEFLAVRKVKGEGPIRQPILCFAGPPGVGKTSLGQSIAHAMNREFVRLSLGGVRDEAEIRGHRRTYIGAMPGQIMQSLRRTGTNNPVFMLDEIDKLGADFRGDPASALLEVLDPQQNNAFRDHYVDAPFDLSSVFFITTANRLDTIPPALRDRMEIITLGGYTEEEKVEIAKRHLVPRQVEEHGLKASQIRFNDDALQKVVRHYTREAGVRNLDREIASVARKATLEFAEGREKKLTVTMKFVEDALGPPKFSHDEVAERELIPGVAVGLVWTPVGGDVIFIETTKMPGKRNLILTGSLGDVMRESAMAALSYIRSHSDELKVAPEFYDNEELHVHVPAGSVPKDGPSAGVTLLAALVSLLTGRPLKQRLAMTGEITLSGQVLPVGGIKEKVLAAYRAGVETVLLPEENKRDYEEEVDEDIREKLKVHFIKEASQVIRHALEPASKAKAKA